MKTFSLAILTAVFTVSGCTQDSPEAPNEASTAAVADVVYTNGKIYTVDENQPWAEAMAIKDGKFLVVGSTDDVVAVTGDKTEIIDLADQFVMPGLVDTHTHPIISALDNIYEFEMNPVPQNLEEMQQQFRAFVAANPEKKWIKGGTFPKGIFAGENPNRRDFDAAVSDRPFCIFDQGGHAYWCNTMALETAGVMEPNFVVPDGGIVERDEDGLPSGTVRETMLGYMDGFAEKPSTEMRMEAIKYVQELFNRNGVTALRTSNGNEDNAKALKAIADRDEITAHWAHGFDTNYLGSIYSMDERMAQIENRKQYESEFVGMDFAKIFIDGDINGYGIAMLEPFPGTEDEYGSTVIDADTVNRLTRQLDKEGISVQYHAIGDRSIRIVADALEMAAEANGGKLNTRHYPDHMGFPAKELERLTRLNGLIGFAPAFGFDFPGVHDSYRQFLGADLLLNLQPLRDALDAGAVIGTGTDYASLPQDPFPLLEGMTHRRNPWVSKEESEPNNAAQAITVEESIHAYTLGGAHALLKEDHIGSIEIGKYADFIVLNQNLLDIPVDDISETEVLKTVFNGHVVYEAGNN